MIVSKNMKPISPEQILGLRSAKQFFSDCYLVSSIHALTQTPNGRKILKQNISTDGSNFNVKFNNINEQAMDFFISAKKLEKLVLVDEFANEIMCNEPHNPIIKAIELTMNKIIQRYPEKKPLVCRLMKPMELFEYNKPSNFMEMFTGRKPIVLNEGGLKMSLKRHKEEAMQLFEQIDKANETSFVAGTGIFCRYGLSDAHCYTVAGVNFENKYIEIIDKRSKKTLQVPFDIAIRGLKYLTGYFNSNL